jgi:hypothetical protein
VSGDAFAAREKQKPRSSSGDAHGVDGRR